MIDHNAKFLTNNVFYLIKGYFYINREKKKVNIKRRYSNFYFLNDKLKEIYYSHIIPFLPEKQKWLKLINDKDKLEERRSCLELYLKSILRIKQFKELNIFHQFLFEKYEFECIQQSEKKKQPFLNTLYSEFCSIFFFFKKDYSTPEQTKILKEIQNLESFVVTIKNGLKNYLKNVVFLKRSMDIMHTFSHSLDFSKHNINYQSLS